MQEDMRTDNTQWTESKTKSLMDDVSIHPSAHLSLAPPIQSREMMSRVCLFCLEDEQPSKEHNESSVANPLRTNLKTEQVDVDVVEESRNMETEPTSVVSSINTTHSLVPNLGDLFSCGCAVYTHGTCLQQWLDIEPTCPMCRTPIETPLDDARDDRVLRLPTTLEATLEGFVFSGEREVDTFSHASCLHNTMRWCCYCSFSAVIMYLLWSSYLVHS